MASSRITVRHGKADLYIPSARSTSMHELFGFRSIFDKHNLINAMIDDELISDQVVIELKVLV
jgi:hypothetical protein